jgi:hypothetical protein
MIIADRTFCNFNSVANKKFYSSFSRFLFKIGSLGWSINNDLAILNKGNGSCYKVIMVEKNDEVIDI